MFPGINGFSWDAGHIIFLGTFFAVVTVIVATVAAATLKTARDFKLHRAEEVRWQAEFHDLSSAGRRCRHELCGDIPKRTCENGFDCRSCTTHARLLADEVGATGTPAASEDVAGFEVPSDRVYHRGHTWVRPGPDGTLDVGLDDLGAHVVGVPDRIELPPLGGRVSVNGTGWRMAKRGVGVRILSPVEGIVVARGGPEDDFVLRVKPVGDTPDTRHLLGGAEASAWMLREAERLQVLLSPNGIGAVLADGGAPVEDFSRVVTPGELDAVCGEIFLAP